MIRRACDIIAAVTGLVITAPIVVFVAAAVRMTSAGPALYRGLRVGRDGVPFGMWKFRSMVVDADKMGGSSTSDDDPHVTVLGAWMRRYKIDELPQLWNVLVGEMSLVGPRPQVPWAVERYTDEEKILLTVRPGITDPASLRFANEGEILRGQSDPDRAYFELIHPEKMRLSIQYVKNRSVLGDAKILVATVAAAVGRRSAATGLPQQGNSAS